MVELDYVIQADIVDIRKYTPKSTDEFIVDSCVWFYLAYSRSSESVIRGIIHKAKDYSDFVDKGMKVDAGLYRCGLSFAELAHAIERRETRLYEILHDVPYEMDVKEFRYNTDERPNVVGEITEAWELVKLMSENLDMQINDELIDAAIAKCRLHSLDGYDLFFLNTMIQNKIPQILTDDRDYCVVPGITVFTANLDLINKARLQGRLISR